MIKNEVRKLNDFGRLFWRQGEFSATQRLEGEVYLTLKGGDPPWPQPALPQSDSLTAGDILLSFFNFRDQIFAKSKFT